MCAISGGTSAPPSETARPPNIRWSTNRSSRPGRPVEQEADPQVPLVGYAGRLHQHLAAHAEVAEQGVAAVEGEPEVLPASVGSGERAPGQAGGEVGRTAGVAAYRTGVQDLDGDDRAAQDVGLEAGADDLDLGKLRHRPPAGSPA